MSLGSARASGTHNAVHLIVAGDAVHSRGEPVLGHVEHVAHGKFAPVEDGAGDLAGTWKDRRVGMAGLWEGPITTQRFQGAAAGRIGCQRRAFYARRAIALRSADPPSSRSAKLVNDVTTKAINRQYQRAVVRLRFLTSHSTAPSILPVPSCFLPSSIHFDYPSLFFRVYCHVNILGSWNGLPGRYWAQPRQAEDPWHVDARPIPDQWCQPPENSAASWRGPSPNSSAAGPHRRQTCEPRDSQTV